jgi:hypothetical protein
MADKPIESILKKNSRHKGINSKHVSITGNNDFSGFKDNKDITQSTNIKKNEKVASSTQRLSKDTLDAIKILYFFLPKKSNKSNASFNDILNSLVDNYVDSAMSERQKETYKQMVKNAKENF